MLFKIIEICQLDRRPLRRAEFLVKLENSLRITSGEKIVSICIPYFCVVPSSRNSTVIIFAVFCCLGPGSSIHMFGV